MKARGPDTAPQFCLVVLEANDQHAGSDEHVLARE